MQAKRKVRVFHAYWPFDRVLNLYKSESFRNSDRQIVFQRVGLAITIFLLTFGFTLAIFSCIWHMYYGNFDISEVSSPLGIAISSVQVSITFASMTKKLERVNVVIGSLQQMIIDRFGDCVLFHFFGTFTRFLSDFPVSRSGPLAQSAALLVRQTKYLRINR